jgi:hypothetical protein
MDIAKVEQHFVFLEFSPESAVLAKHSNIGLVLLKKFKNLIGNDDKRSAP